MGLMREEGKRKKTNTKRFSTYFSIYQHNINSNCKNLSIHQTAAATTPATVTISQ